MLTTEQQKFYEDFQTKFTSIYDTSKEEAFKFLQEELSPKKIENEELLSEFIDKFCGEHEEIMKEFITYKTKRNPDEM